MEQGVSPPLESPTELLPYWIHASTLETEQNAAFETLARAYELSPRAISTA